MVIRFDYCYYYYDYDYQGGDRQLDIWYQGYHILMQYELKEAEEKRHVSNLDAFRFIVRIRWGRITYNLYRYTIPTYIIIFPHTYRAKDPRGGSEQELEEIEAIQLQVKHISITFLQMIESVPDDKDITNEQYKQLVIVGANSTQGNL